MVAILTPAIAAPPALPTYALVAIPSTATPKAREHDRLLWDRRLKDDRFIRLAPTGLDEGIIVAVQKTIDGPIFHDPYRSHGSSPSAFLPAPKLYRVAPIPPRPR
jgi:hypothetical protein